MTTIEENECMCCMEVVARKDRVTYRSCAKPHMICVTCHIKTMVSQAGVSKATCMMCRVVIDHESLTNSEVVRDHDKRLVSLLNMRFVRDANQISCSDREYDQLLRRQFMIFADVCIRDHIRKNMKGIKLIGSLSREDLKNIIDSIGEEFEEITRKDHANSDEPKYAEARQYRMSNMIKVAFKCYIHYNMGAGKKRLSYTKCGGSVFLHT